MPQLSTDLTIIEDLSELGFEELITQHCAGNNQLSAPLTNAISNLSKYFTTSKHSNPKQNLLDFTNSLINDHDEKFYQTFLENFKKQPHKKNVEFLLISCFLRDFTKAQTPEDLKIIFTYGGIVPKAIIEIHQAENEAKKENLKRSITDKISDTKVKILLSKFVTTNMALIILDYIQEEKLLDHLLQYIHKFAITSETQNFLKSSEFENTPQDFDLKKLQEVVIDQINIHQNAFELEEAKENPALTLSFKKAEELTRAESTSSTISTSSITDISDFDISALMMPIDRNRSLSTKTESSYPDEDLSDRDDENEPMSLHIETEDGKNINGDRAEAVETPNSQMEEIEIITRKRSLSEIKSNSGSVTPPPKINKPVAQELQTPQLARSNSQGRIN